MTMSETVTLRVWRGDASGGELKEDVVPTQEGMVVLDVVHTLQATQAGDLSVRWNCKAGKCGSCSAEINGKPRLMCMTRGRPAARRSPHRRADADVPAAQGDSDGRG